MRWWLAVAASGRSEVNSANADLWHPPQWLTGGGCDSGLIFHDFRRTAARNLRRAGLAATVMMKIGGWRTRSAFERYAMESKNDIADAMRKPETSERAGIDHEMSHAAQAAPTEANVQRIN